MLVAGSFAAVIATGLKRAAADEETGPECAWAGGESLEDVAKEWSTSVGASHAIQDASAELLRHPDMVLNSRELNRASQLMSAVNSSERVGVMYRGMEVSQADATRLLELSGREFTLPLSSFTTDRTIGEEFAALGLNDVSVLIEVRGARGLDISDWVLEDYQRQAEHLVVGTFRVGPVYHSGKDIWMILEEM